MKTLRICVWGLCAVLTLPVFWGCSNSSSDDTGHDISDVTMDDSTADTAQQDRLVPPDVTHDTEPELPPEDLLSDEVSPPMDVTDITPDSADVEEDTDTTAIPEEVVESPAAACDECLLLKLDQWDGLADEVNYPTQADYTHEFEGQMFFFRPWMRFRVPHPGFVERLYVYTAGAGVIEVGLSTGFPGGHHPCLDENTGEDMYPVGEPIRMEVTQEPGWRVLDFTELGHQLLGYDEFFVIFSMEGEARVGLHYPIEFSSTDYDSYGGLIADAPGDDMICFSSMSNFTDAMDNNMIWLMRAEIRSDTIVEDPQFHDSGDEGPVVGGHLAFGDYDNDGDEDFLSGGKLFENDGTGSFTEITAEAGLEGVGGETLWGDYDNDGFRDIVAFKTETRLFHNQGDGTFVEVTEGAGLTTEANNQGGSWVDFEQDGLLDLFIASYGTLEDSEVAQRDYLFRNQGDGTFLDVTQAMGLPLDSKKFHGRGVCVADVDHDSDPDIYVGNYRLDPNFLWMNNGGETGFEDQAYFMGVLGSYAFGAYGHTIGPAFGDLNGDGWFDLVVPNLAHPRFFDFSDPTMLNISKGEDGDPTGEFDPIKGESRGVRYDETHSDATLFDADNDGDVDLFLTSIYVGRRSYYYRNDGTGHFADFTYDMGIQQFNGWGAAAADIDNDGDQDLVARRLFVNQLDADTHYLEVKLMGGATPENHDGLSNRDAIGAVVTVSFGTQSLVRQVEGGKGVGCQNSSVLHFGLGDHDGPVTLEIRWPSGQVDVVEDVSVDQRLEIAE